MSYRACLPRPTRGPLRSDFNEPAARVAARHQPTACLCGDRRARTRFSSNRTAAFNQSQMGQGLGNVSPHRAR